jgi:hypothetical protein
MSEIDNGAPEGAADEALLSVDQTEGDAIQPLTDAPAPEPQQSAIDKRIAKYAAAAHAAKRQAEDLTRRLEELEQRAPRPSADAEPDPNAFDNDADYTRALIRHEARQMVVQERSQAETSARQREDQSRTEAMFDKGRAKHADFDEVVLEGAANNEWPCTKEMLEAMRESETGSDLAYHLATNPDEARRIAALGPIAQVREITKLEARMGQPAPRLTKAPEPPLTKVGATGAGGPEQELARLEAEAERTGDRTPVIAFKRRQASRG